MFLKLCKKNHTVNYLFVNHPNKIAPIAHAHQKVEVATNGYTVFSHTKSHCTRYMYKEKTIEMSEKISIFVSYYDFILWI